MTDNQKVLVKAILDEIGFKNTMINAAIISAVLKKFELTKRGDK